ncbi:hypothetical protein PHIM7_209 [Sinorhizobium phage phiM7]|uniref:Uncharacterized protein n=3 Tax=Emdodecavirus TaxID=1980937 RepID=S5MPZ9_9CAUD|nr:hypothetical protein AB690_gp297 [Sinorhizobium phage phiM12]YP_009212461.1 hypothetical protein AVT40_gp312 [Sinorhizobium phage phiN3]YP_009601334.1 hypothetical protein FDH46_gp269 [Sinorhizobium phage phiM7]AKF13114.1 hypothetical protein PHIM19_209 [Sinorhizobium phage phiM19]AGR47910.2 hypothetical protein SmphiM12_278 [Sinorhizobium phage phiM12]AKF12754.1 hypothetical protein PHIM7_209 [Sinorhizobium phage phiM7]AKF13484.1 hypothetical protein PHIN3_221 [Sinorhizobium phage phiN3]
MSKTYRNRHRVTHYTCEAKFKARMWRSPWTGECSPFYDENDWERYGRDKSFDYGRRKRYRAVTNEEIRNQNRIDIHRIMKDPENYDDMTFADKKNGKPHIWSIW